MAIEQLKTKSTDSGLLRDAMAEYSRSNDSHLDALIDHGQVDAPGDIYPSDPRWISSIYVDETRTERHLKANRLLAEHRKRHPGRKFRIHPIHPNQLRRFRLSRHTQMEATFLKNGYVCDLEFRRTGRGDGRQLT